MSVGWSTSARRGGARASPFGAHSDRCFSMRSSRTGRPGRTPDPPTWAALSLYAAPASARRAIKTCRKEMTVAATCHSTRIRVPSIGTDRQHLEDDELLPGLIGLDDVGARVIGAKTQFPLRGGRREDLETLNMQLPDHSRGGQRSRPGSRLAPPPAAAPVGVSAATGRSSIRTLTDS